MEHSIVRSNAIERVIHQFQLQEVYSASRSQLSVCFLDEIRVNCVRRAAQLVSEPRLVLWRTILGERIKDAIRVWLTDDDPQRTKSGSQRAV